MALRYGLVENLLTADPDDFMAVTLDNKTMTIEDVVERMISRGSTVTKAGALATIEEFNLAICDIVKGGNNVNTELFTVYPSIAGVFNSETESFNPKKHAIKINMRAGRRLYDASRNLAVERVKVAGAKPTIQTLSDLKSNAVNESISIGQIASLKGSMMKIDETNENAGLFLIDAEGNETKVTQVVKNKPSEILFFVPDTITPGDYILELRTVLPRRKELVTARLGHTLVATT